MARQPGQDEGLFPGMDLLAQAIALEKAEKAEKQNRQELFLQGVRSRQQQQAADLAAQREQRVAQENQRRANTKMQMDVENLRTDRAQLSLSQQRLAWEQQKANTEMQYKIIADARNRMQRRADMILTLNMRMYSMVLNSNNPQQGYNKAKKDLETTRNTFAAVQQAVQWWDRDPATRGKVLANANSAQFNMMLENPGIKKAMEGLDSNQRSVVQNTLTRYAALPEDQRAQFMNQLKEDEQTATAMSTVYNSVQDPKQAAEFVESVIQKTNREINEIYANMPSFNGVSPQPYLQKYVEPSRQPGSVSDLETAWNSTKPTSSAPETTSQEEASPTSSSTATNEEGYYSNEDAASPDEGGQTNESGYYDDEEDE